MRRWMPLTLSLALVFTAGACRGKDEPTPPPEDETVEMEPIAITPMLSTEKVKVEYRARELAEGRELEAEESLEIVPGANVITSEGGRARIDWDGFLSQHILDGTDTLLSLSQPEMRYVIVDQATGTARYTLLGASEPASVTVKAASWSDVVLDEGEAEVIVSIVPGTEPASWIAVLEGQATVKRNEDSLILTKGQVAAFTDEGDMPVAAAIDGELLGDWYDDVEAGNDVGNMAAIGQRCEVTAEEAVVLEEPDEDADPKGDPLAKGTIVAVIQRDEPGTYVRVTDESYFAAFKDTATGELPEDMLDGWVASEDLSCNGPTSGVSQTAPEEMSDLPTATAPPLPTRAPVVVPTLLPTLAVTFTPTPTVPAVGSSVEFTADDKTITKGDCTRLRWKLRNIKAWYLDGGAGVGDDGDKKVCPTKTTTYTIRVILPDDSEIEKSVTIKVNDPADEATATPGATATDIPPAASATPIVIATDPPPTATNVPPTAVPPTATNEPPTQEPPTETPEPDPPTETPEPDPPTETPEPPTQPAPGP